jgi:hypothetical protein
MYNNMYVIFFLSNKLMWSKSHNSEANVGFYEKF